MTVIKCSSKFTHRVQFVYFFTHLSFQLWFFLDKLKNIFLECIKPIVKCFVYGKIKFISFPFVKPYIQVIHYILSIGNYYLLSKVYNKTYYLQHCYWVEGFIISYSVSLYAKVWCLLCILKEMHLSLYLVTEL